MLGHQLVQGLSNTFELVATMRSQMTTDQSAALFANAKVLCNCDLMQNLDLSADIIKEIKPDAVINAVGIVKQRMVSNDVLQSIEINAALPHRLAAHSVEAGARLIHISTDCVFSGAKGLYTESDIPDATDIYGRTKHLGEISEKGCLTLRTSIIGLELNRKRSLIEWFLSQTGQVEGFTKAIFSGLTTAALTDVIREILTEHSSLSGIFHVASDPISKYDLLSRLAGSLKLSTKIVPSAKPAMDRSLDPSRFIAQTGISTPSWDKMLTNLAHEIQCRKAT